VPEVGNAFRNSGKYADVSLRDTLACQYSPLGYIGQICRSIAWLLHRVQKRAAMIETNDTWNGVATKRSKIKSLQGLRYTAESG
jgi:hypothetical protein